ncbi:MAG TPA: 16S rRNA (cytidine(1402)-2'-O)-methyltransferase [Bryobacterales bacterium]|jgi:16S rRNA (cytidine1402-2'-O)-methyltransferase|nr:16S rRNA (cytidine(1402)-2'-O)-methyltransferase [Bryobacterales bacterium]
MTGAIYLVATPIGNLEDITLRGLRILKEAGLIACEDTRQTRKLLEHYQIHKPLVSCHEHNEAERAEELVKKALAGEKIAVVSDAGMPGISDPGYRVVTRAIQAGVPVIPVPGPVAIEAAIAACGLPAESFHFGGFLPAKRGQRRKVLQSLRAETAPLVFYEAPHRIVDTLEDVIETLGPRPVAVARELTKVHEEFLRGPAPVVLDELRSRSAVKGEITLIIGRGSEPSAVPAGVAGSIGRRMEELMREQALDHMTALKQAARERGLSKREAYRQWQKAKEEE